MLVRHTGRAPARVTADRDRETVLDARDARRYGLVDRMDRAWSRECADRTCKRGEPPVPPPEPPPPPASTRTAAEVIDRHLDVVTRPAGSNRAVRETPTGA